MDTPNIYEALKSDHEGLELTLRQLVSNLQETSVLPAVSLNRALAPDGFHVRSLSLIWLYLICLLNIYKIKRPSVLQNVEEGEFL